MQCHVRIHCALLLALAATGAWADNRQSWDYKSYQKDRATGQYSKERFVTSTITLDEKDGAAIFRMLTAGRGDPCINKGDLPAEVQRTPATIVITVTSQLAGCEPFRYVIRSDGSGGVRQSRRDERWVDDGLDHGLTPAK